ncbi:monovalent cation/H(+) antiporter subunit G [Alkalilimnicola ehrlichii]|uniref:monovalent cation/H(+) antiporter subunit G n=1 Tax=Alkalilimnicola ehrlichii TaxID=351052 RepID=UPI003B9E3C15
MTEFLSTLSTLLVALLLLAGGGFMILAAVGVLRLPDLPTRMHASTKAGALGASLTMLAVAFYLPEGAIVARALAVIVFILLTAPVAAHVIGRAGYFVGVPLWEGTVKDELKKHYDPESHGLESGFEGPPGETGTESRRN